MDTDELMVRLREFAAARDWDQFHSPKNLTMALSVEASELAELFQWLTQAESRQLNGAERAAAMEEIGDIGIYLLRLCDKLEVDLERAIRDKIELNEEKYPIDLARGNATKYNRRGHGGDE